MGDCTEEEEEDADKVLHWNEGINGNNVLRCLRSCTNSNPTFVGVLSLNLENHLLPTFQKCLCIFYTLRLINERPILRFQPPLLLSKKKKQDHRNKPPQTAVPQNENGSPFPPSKWMLSRTCVTGY